MKRDDAQAWLDGHASTAGRHRPPKPARRVDWEFWVIHVVGLVSLGGGAFCLGYVLSAAHG